MPRRKRSSPFLDMGIDDRLGQLARAWHGHHPTIQDIRKDRILPNPTQRFSFAVEARDLVAIVREQGIQRPLWVCPHPEKATQYQLLYGPQWRAAASIAGLPYIPCVVVLADAETLKAFGLIETLQRVSLPLLEEAGALRWLLDTHGYTIRSLAAWLGWKKGYLENRLALLHLPADLQQLVIAQPETLSAALQLAKIDDPERRADLLTSVRDGLLTVATIRAEVQALRRPKGGRRKAEGGKEDYDALPGESTVQRILMHWKTLSQDEDTRLRVDAALARTRALITDMAEEGSVDTDIRT
jgi:ParB family transcriptional regulator, chromosome partitioning protein